MDVADQITLPKHQLKSVFPLLLRSFSYLKPYWKISVGALFTVVGILALNLILPQFVRWIIDEGITKQNYPLLNASVAGLLFVTALRGVLVYFQGQWSEVASQNVAYDLRNLLQDKITHLSFSYHDNAQTGDLLARTVQDVERIRFLTGRASLRIAEGVLMIIGTALVLIGMDRRLGGMLLMMTPILILIAIRFGVQYRPLSMVIQEQIGALTTQVEQNLRGTRVVKAFAQEEVEITRFEKKNEFLFGLNKKAAGLQASIEPLLFLVANFGTVIILLYGGNLVMDGELSIGELVAFTTYMGQLVQPVRRLGLVIPAVMIASSSAERVFEILDAVSEVQDAQDAVPLPEIKGHVRFEHVRLSYGRHTVLTDINFEILPGEMVAFVGPTGSGKSSIINLLPRFYDPSQGQITIDGLDIRKSQLISLRSQIGIVLQETTLFAGTIRENIAFGKPEASEEEIRQAALAAQAVEFIQQLPQGYDTMVGERGVTLSGGQKQRIAIARAILMDPAILILDDATSSVDAETEVLIQRALDRLIKGRTTLVIAHRLSTIRKAHKIILVNAGRIAAQGTHEELMQNTYLYREIYHTQFREQENMPAEPELLLLNNPDSGEDQ